MRHSIKVGISFGLTSGVITTLGLVVGLYASTNMRLAAIGGVVIIAVSDSLSDALGIHVAEEAENKHTPREVWESTFSTAAAKFLVTSTFIVPLLFLGQTGAILTSIAWGYLLIGVFSYYISRNGDTSPWKVVVEHFTIATLVVAATHFLGLWISRVFA